MSSFSRYLGGFFGSKAGKAALSIGTTALAAKASKPSDPPAPPEPATIDDAKQNRDVLDRIRRRRGALANIFGGASSTAASPSVGVKTLTGQ